MRKIFLLIFIVSSVLLLSVEFPKPTPYKYVNDYVGVLDKTTVEKIISVGKELENKTTAQVVVVVVPSLSGLTVEEYANRLFREWGIGQKEKNNGVLLLVAMNDRKVRIEVGYGLEGAIPDGKAGRILDEYVIPYFKTESTRKGSITATLPSRTRWRKSTEWNSPGLLIFLKEERTSAVFRSL